MGRIDDSTSRSPITTEQVSCDGCGSIEAERIFVGRDFQHHIPGDWTVVRCTRCGLSYTNPRPDRNGLDQIYPEDYTPYRQRKRKNKSFRWHLRQWALQCHWGYPPPGVGRLAKVLSWPLLVWFQNNCRREGLIPWEGQGRLLDYGCGAGGYLDLMQQRGWTVTGMDMSAQALGVCRQQGFAVHQGIDPGEVFEAESFDVVSLWHVIEHVPSPTATLRQMHDILAARGKLVLVMPNIDSTLARRYGIYWFPMELPRHFSHFNRSTITQLLDKCGFEVELIRGQKHGRVFHKTVQYLAAEKKGIYVWLARRKKLCCWVEHLVDFWGEPSVLMVQARKRPG